MSTTTPFIDGVLVHRDVLDLPMDWMTEKKSHLRFRCHRYSFPSTALHARSHSQPIPLIEELLGLRISILYIHRPTPVEKSRDLPVGPAAPYFFGYGYSNTLLRAIYTVVFRVDLKPLHPRQVEVLCKFCVGGLLAGEFFYFWPSLGLAHTRDLANASTQHKVAARLIKGVWRNNYSVNTFSAYFHSYRHYKLLGGDEEWREIKSPYDV